MDKTFVTPTINALAEQGTKFTSFYAQSLCTPTRASLLTGRMVTQTELQGGPILDGQDRYLPLDIATTGEHFQQDHEKGYSTYFIGKWHLGLTYLNMTPLNRGYDYHFGISGPGADPFSKESGMECGSEEDDYKFAMSNNCTLMAAYDLAENNIPYIDNVTYLGEILADKAVERISLHDTSKPMLMHYHSTAPHTPLKPPPFFFELCQGVSEGHESVGRPDYRQQICGLVAALDFEILRLLLALDSRGMLSSTLILYHSDNGGLLMAGSLNSPFRSEKGSLFEGGIRVPAFIYGGGVPSHRTCGDLFDVSDVLPTIIGYAGIRVNASASGIDGMNHWQRIVGQQPLLRGHIPVVAAGADVGYFSAWIEEIDGTRWKYVLNPEFMVNLIYGQPRDQLEGEYLFNLGDDPAERVNLARSDDATMQHVLNRLRMKSFDQRTNARNFKMPWLPPTLDFPPSPGGCRLPMDSPRFDTARCPVALFPPIITRAAAEAMGEERARKYVLDI